MEDHQIIELFFDRDENAVVVHDSARQILRRIRADVVDAQRNGAALELFNKHTERRFMFAGNTRDFNHGCSRQT